MLVPQERLDDGNPCNDDEELHAGLCYEKCSALTMGAYVYRQSAWTCCNKEVCGAFSLLTGKCCKHHMGFCTGFDIAGFQEGQNVCPHKPGACLTNEELFLDVCYMKCSLLTANKYPYRVAAATCCQSRKLDCLIQDAKGVKGKSVTRADFNVGGGSCSSVSEDQPNSTDCKPHEPLERLTEQ